MDNVHHFIVCGENLNRENPDMIANKKIIGIISVEFAGIILKLMAIILFLVLGSPAKADIDTLWTRQYGGSEFDGASTLSILNNEGFALGGWTESFAMGQLDLWLLITDADGDTSWTRTYGGSEREGASRVFLDADSGFNIIGNTNSFGAGSYDCWILRCNSEGDTLWTKTIGWGIEDRAIDAQRTASSGYIIAGYTNSTGAGGYDYLLIKADSNWDTLWVRTYGGVNNDRAYSIQVADDGGYVFSGYGGDGFYYDLIKVDSLGEFVWGLATGGEFYSVERTGDGGFVAAGTKCRDGYCRLFLQKVDSEGQIDWGNFYGNSPDWSVAKCIRQCPDGGFIVAGYTGNWYYEDLYVLKTDSIGNKEWDLIFNVPGGHSGAYAVEPTTDGNYIVAGYIGDDNGDSDVWLLKIGDVTSVEDENNDPHPTSFGNLKIYPNPTNAIAKISYTVPQGFPQPAVGHPGEVILTIYNRLGQRMYEQTVMHQKPGRYSTSWDGSRYPSGIYLVRVKMGELSETKRLLILK